MGAAPSCSAPKLTGLRRWRVNDFEKFLIFDLAVRKRKCIQLATLRRCVAELISRNVQLREII